MRESEGAEEGRERGGRGSNGRRGKNGTGGGMDATPEPLTFPARRDMSDRITLP